MTTRRKLIWITSTLVFTLAVWLFAQDPAQQSVSTTTTATHAPMELFGIGPEMFENRMLAWVHCIAKILKEAVIEIGAIVVLIILTKKNIDQKKELKDAKEEFNRRLENQGNRIHEVAIAAQPTNTP